MARGDSDAFLGPGFRFHPTDEELLRYYLKRKVTNKPLRFDPISVVDVYRSEPWDLPDRAKLKSRDLEWYFFSLLDRKYGNGAKTNRATEKGYWKTTGKDRPIRSNSVTVGMKKTLVYHLGRAPRGERSNWVMHEYRLSEEELEKFGVGQDTYVLCRIFQKSGTGPKNGEQYGAPFVEEEWEDDDVPLLPGENAVVAGSMDAVYGDYLDAVDFDQKFDVGDESATAAAPLASYYEETNNYVEHGGSSSEDGSKPLIDGALGTSVMPVDQQLPCAQNEVDTNCGDANYIGSSTKDLIPPKNEDINGSTFVDAGESSQFADGLFLEACELPNNMEPGSCSEDPTDFNLEEYLDFDDLSFDPFGPVESDGTYDLSPESNKDLNGGVDNVDIRSENLSSMAGHASSSEQNLDSMTPKLYSMKPDYETNYPFIGKASKMLGDIPAPPAFAAEFPMKGAALRFASAQEPSSSIRVTAGMIRIENMGTRGNEMDGLMFGKNTGVNIVMSISWPQGENGSGLKTGSMSSRVWLSLMFFWILVLSVSYKVGTCICAK
ncbi:NAC domain-containing protein 78 [Linum perenne]